MNINIRCTMVQSSERLSEPGKLFSQLRERHNLSDVYTVQGALCEFDSAYSYMKRYLSDVHFRDFAFVHDMPVSIFLSRIPFDNTFVYYKDNYFVHGVRLDETWNRCVLLNVVACADALYPRLPKRVLQKRTTALESFLKGPKKRGSQKESKKKRPIVIGGDISRKVLSDIFNVTDFESIHGVFYRNTDEVYIRNGNGGTEPYDVTISYSFDPNIR